MQPVEPQTPTPTDASEELDQLHINVPNELDSSSEDEDGWQDMQPVSNVDIYSNGQLVIAAEQHESTPDLTVIEEKKDVIKTDISAGDGYTRAAAEGQATASREADEKTDFLFQDDTPTTKTMLSEAEKFAYIGCVNILTFEIAEHLASGVAISAKRKVQYRLQKATRSMGEWRYDVMCKLKTHLELSDEESRMIDNLSSHGADIHGLSKCLKVKKQVDIGKSQDLTVIGDESQLEGKIDIDVAWTVICDLFFLLLADSHYDARSRTLLQKFCQELDVTELEQFETRISESFDLETETKEVKKRNTKKKRYAYIAMATIGGSLVLGLGVGLLAPVIGAGIAAGLGTMGVTGATSFLTGAAGTSIVAVSGTAIGAKVGGTAMARRVGDVHTFEFKPLHNNRRVNLIVTVSGWITGKEDDVRLPFSTIDPAMGDLYSLLWEPEMLRSMGQTINIVATEALTQSIQQILGVTILTALMSAVQLPMALSKLSYIIDNPWNVSLDRAWRCGLLLADTIMSRNLGERPITLVGFSLGARVIYSCLMELGKRGAFGLVQDVILFGTPCVIKKSQLAQAKSVVSGRFVNGYSSKDWILGYLFRATGGGVGLRAVAGISEVEGLENLDCTELVPGHMQYRQNIPKLMKKLGWSVLSEDFVEISEPDPEQLERQRQLIHEFEEAKNKKESVAPKKKKGWKKWFGSKKKQEWWENVIPDADQIDHATPATNPGPNSVTNPAFVSVPITPIVNEEPFGKDDFPESTIDKLTELEINRSSTVDDISSVSGDPWGDGEKPKSPETPELVTSASEVKRSAIRRPRKDGITISFS